jgi:tetratricopeptide (TPR) repeat protein
VALLGSAVVLLAVQSPAFADTFDDIVRDAEAAYAAGKLEDAATLLDKAYAMRHDPTLLFNKGRALQDVQPERAIAAYEAYLAAQPGAPDAAKVRLIIERLRARIAQEESLRRRTREAEAAAARERGSSGPGAPPAATTGRSVAVAPWIITGVGAATLAASLPLWLAGSSAHDDAVAARSVSESDSRQRTAQDFASATSVTLVAGGVIVAIGLAWAIVDLTRSPSARVSHTPGQGTF